MCDKCGDTGFIVKLLDNPIQNKDGIWKDREYINCNCNSYDWKFDKDRLGNMVYEYKKLAIERKNEITALEYKLSTTIGSVNELMWLNADLKKEIRILRKQIKEN